MIIATFLLFFYLVFVVIYSPFCSRDLFLKEKNQF